MGAYNILFAPYECYQCHQWSLDRFQVQIGWTRYDRYMLGDDIRWMPQPIRDEANDRTKPEDLRTMLEYGDASVHHYAVSLGSIHFCPNCNAKGSAVAIVDKNYFVKVEFVQAEIEYGEIFMDGLRGTEFDTQE